MTRMMPFPMLSVNVQELDVAGQTYPPILVAMEHPAIRDRWEDCGWATPRVLHGSTRRDLLARQTASPAPSSITLSATLAARGKATPVSGKCCAGALVKMM